MLWARWLVCSLCIFIYLFVNLTLLFSALIADQTGNYIYSFYMTGGVLITAALIPLILICVNRGKSKVHPQGSEILGEEENFGKVSKEVQTVDDAEVFGRRLRAGTLTRKRSASALI